MTHNALKHLGLRDMEAAVLARLIRHPGATGYQIARAIDKPAANVYAALESLARRHLADAAPGRPRRWSARPPREILRAFDRDARRRRRELCAALGVDSNDDADVTLIAARAREAMARIARALEEGIDIDALEALCQEVVGSTPTGADRVSRAPRTPSDSKNSRY